MIQYVNLLIREAVEAGASCVIQPGGSISDDEVVAARLRVGDDVGEGLHGHAAARVPLPANARAGGSRRGGVYGRICNDGMIRIGDVVVADAVSHSVSM